MRHFFHPPSVHPTMSIDSILCTRSYYEIFNLTAGEVSPESLKRSYKRLALICHPDKSSHPDAEVAFKKIHRAFTVLSDENLRRVYDIFGDGGNIQEESVIEEASAMFPGMDPVTAVRIMAVLMGVHNGPSEPINVTKLFNRPTEESMKKVRAILVLIFLFSVKLFI
jgi:DnaJ-class molecular chaperone